MNLIEQLGGYKKAKQYFLKLQNTPMHEQAEDTIYLLQDELLEYQRQHNIFEENDFVVIPSRGDELFKVNRHLSRSDRDEMRHATDVEIKAGKRLEVL